MLHFLFATHLKGQEISKIVWPCNNSEKIRLLRQFFDAIHPHIWQDNYESWRFLDYLTPLDYLENSKVLLDQLKIEWLKCIEFLIQEINKSLFHSSIIDYFFQQKYSAPCLHFIKPLSCLWDVLHFDKQWFVSIIWLLYLLFYVHAHHRTSNLIFKCKV